MATGDWSIFGGYNGYRRLVGIWWLEWLQTIGRYLVVRMATDDWSVVGG